MKVYCFSCLLLTVLLNVVVSQSQDACSTFACKSCDVCEVNGLGQPKCIYQGGPQCCTRNMVNCFVDPCFNFAQRCPQASKCVSDYCGGCNAIYYDRNLDRMNPNQCKAATPPPPSYGCQTVRCSAGFECQVNRIGQGKCVQKPNDCGLRRVMQVQCLVDPCADSATACPRARKCVPNNCGTCSAVYYDFLLNKIENCVRATDPTPEPCSTIYCGRGRQCVERQGRGVCIADTQSCETHQCGPNQRCVMWRSRPRCVRQINDEVQDFCSRARCSSNTRCGRCANGRPGCCPIQNSPPECAAVSCIRGTDCVVINGRAQCTATEPEPITSCTARCRPGYTCKLQNGRSTCVLQSNTNPCSAVLCRPNNLCVVRSGRGVCVPQSGGILDEKIKICSQPTVTGPCRADMRRYRYDRVVGRCVQFQYGGCKGNDNNFETMQECETACQGVPQCPVASVMAPPPGCEYKDEQNERGCFFPMLVCTGGVCANQCQAPCQVCQIHFQNNRKFKCHVQRDCVQQVQDNDNNNNDDENVPVQCKLPKAQGPCEAYFPSYFYNTATGSCEFFAYGGCQGNANRFATEQLCQRVCIAKRQCIYPPVARPPPGCKYNITKDAEGCSQFNNLICDKPGQCPNNNRGGFGICIQECSNDNECQGAKKCCSNGCGNTCQDPLREVPGVKFGQCPSAEGRIGICVEQCSGHDSCPGDKLCCSNGCGHTCQNPVQVGPRPIGK